MAKKITSKPGKKASKPVSKPAPKAVKTAAKASKPVLKKSVKPAAKPVSKPHKASASKPKVAAKPVKKTSSSAKPAPKAAPQKVAPAPKSKPVAKSAPAKTNTTKPEVIVKKKEVPVPAVKPAPVKAAPAKTAPEPVKQPEATTPAVKLPPLPRNFRLAKKKGKIIPGEKRVVKLETINHHVIKDKPLEPEKTAKAEPKGKFTVEQPIRSSAQFLFDFLSTPNGLIEWFADEAELKGDTYTFKWDGATQEAKIINAKLDSYIRMRWMDKPAGTYFEMRIDLDPITSEIMLVITDFGENENDIRNLRALWESQIQQLLKALVTY